jgi:hypothetical protein
VPDFKARLTRGEKWAVAQEAKRGRVGGVGRTSGLAQRAGTGRATQEGGRERARLGTVGLLGKAHKQQEKGFEPFSNAVNSVRNSNSNTFESNKFSKLFQSLFTKL